MSREDLQVLVSKGVNLFVNLQSSYTEYGCRDYRKTLHALRNEKPEEFYVSRSIRFLHVPVADFETMPDSTMLALVKLLSEVIVARSSIMYIHCYGGHGRTGSVVANLLAALRGKKSLLGLKIIKILFLHFCYFFLELLFFIIIILYYCYCYCCCRCCFLKPDE